MSLEWLIHRNVSSYGISSNRIVYLSALLELFRAMHLVPSSSNNRKNRTLAIVSSMDDEDHLIENPKGFSSEYSLDNETRREIRHSALQLSRQWYQCEVIGTEMHRQLHCSGVNLGDIVSWELHYPISSALESIAFFEEIITTERPDHVWAVGSPFCNALLSQVAKNQQLDVKQTDYRIVPLLYSLAARFRPPKSLLDLIGKPEAAQPESHLRNDAQRPGVLLIVDGISIASIAGEVSHALACNCHANPVVLAWTQSGVRQLMSSGVPHKQLADYYLPRDDQQGYAKRDSFARLWKNLSSDNSELADLFTYRKVRFWRPWMVHLLSRVLRSRFIQVVSAISTVKRVIEVERPSLIALGWDGSWINHIFIQIARQYGIPSVMVQDGINLYAAERGINADYVAVQGAFARDDYLTGGLSPERIFVTGQPRYDALYRRAGKKEHAALRARLGIEEDEIVVLMFAATGTDFMGADDQKERYERLVMSELANRAGYRLLIKLHHSDPGRITPRLSTEFKARNILTLREPSATDLIEMADIVICATESSTALECALLNKPLLFLDFDHSSWLPPFVNDGLAKYVCEPNQLLLYIEQFKKARLNTGFHVNNSKVVLDQWDLFDGNSSDRLAELLVELSSK